MRIRRGERRGEDKEQLTINNAFCSKRKSPPGQLTIWNCGQKSLPLQICKYPKRKKRTSAAPGTVKIRNASASCSSRHSGPRLRNTNFAALHKHTNKNTIITNTRQNQQHNIENNCNLLTYSILILRFF